MTLWLHWWNAVFLLRPACARLRTFLWFAAGVAGLTVRMDTLGVTSIVRGLRLHARFYARLLANFHSAGVNLDEMTALWAQVVLRLFAKPLRVNGRVVLVGDGIKVGKRGRKMPAVKLLHQASDSNTKPEYIMGHSLQAVRLSACSLAPVTASSLCPWRRAFMRALFGPTAIDAPCSTRCSLCWGSSRSGSRSTLSLMPTTPPARSSGPPRSEQSPGHSRQVQRGRL